MTREDLEAAIDFFLSKRVNDAMKKCDVNLPRRHKMAIHAAFMQGAVSPEGEYHNKFHTSEVKKQTGVLFSTMKELERNGMYSLKSDPDCWAQE